MEHSSQYKQFISTVFAVGSNVVKALLIECIDHIEDKSVQKKLEKKLNEIIPDTPIGARKIMFDNKTFLMVIKPVDDVDNYSIVDEIDRIKSIIPEDKHEHLQGEINMTMSIVPSLYKRILETHEKDFTEMLINNLPEDRKNIRTNLIEYQTSMFSMYEDGMRFGLFTEKES